MFYVDISRPIKRVFYYLKVNTNLNDLMTTARHRSDYR